jgi:flavin reductase (DIM6/NTAB) family NADH-FMN oxidoreductase RutF
MLENSVAEPRPITQRSRAQQPECEPLVAETKRALRRLASSVSIVTCRYDGRDHAMTATAVSALSMAPPAMLVCINRSGAFHAAIERADEFAINILSRAQIDISKPCSGGAKAESRFDVGFWDTRATAPVLLDAQAAIICRKDKTLEYGTHTIFMGRIVSVAMNGDVDPLIYVDGQYTGRAA